MGELQRATAIYSVSLSVPRDVSLLSVSPCRHYIYPCSLLSANTFTFLVLLSNKRGGMSGGLLPLLKQTSMNSPY